MTLHVLRVFTGPDGSHGNPLGVFLRGSDVPEGDRQRVAAELGFSETVFVDDLGSGALRIYTPANELPFAGHPLVGTAWLLAREGSEPSVLRPPAGEVGVRLEDEAVWITARGEWAPEFTRVELESAAEVEALEGPPANADETYAWAWSDRDAGEVRARSFAPGFGIPEDEATGSAVLALCVDLGVPIVVRQGRGSVLRARPLGDGRAEVGGTVALDERRDFRI